MATSLRLLVPVLLMCLYVGEDEIRPPPSQWKMLGDSSAARVNPPPAVHHPPLTGNLPYFRAPEGNPAPHGKVNRGQTSNITVTPALPRLGHPNFPPLQESAVNNLLGE